MAGKFAEEPCNQHQPQYPRQDADSVQVESTRLPDGADALPSTGIPSPYLPPDTFEERSLRNSPRNVSPAQEPALGTFDTSAPLQSSDMGQRISGLDQYRDHQYASSSPKHPALPVAGGGASTSNASPIVPMSAGPSYSAAMAIPISPKPRAYAQQPTYITPSSAPNPVNPLYSQPQVPKEDVCIECAMRDQDMADVDVTTPGVWRRDSDADYDDLLRRELDDEAMGISPKENSSRPRARGGRLTEENLKLWLSMVRHPYFFSCELVSRRHTPDRTPKNHRLGSKHLTSMSRLRGHCSKQKLWLTHELCVSHANWTTRCETPILSCGGRHTSLAVVRSQRTTRVASVSKHLVLSLHRTLCYRIAVRLRSWRMA